MNGVPTKEEIKKDYDRLKELFKDTDNWEDVANSNGIGYEKTEIGIFIYEFGCLREVNISKDYKWTSCVWADKYLRNIIEYLTFDDILDDAYDIALENCSKGIFPTDDDFNLDDIME